MNKEEFLNELQESLLGEVSEYEIKESLNYYNDYIIQEMNEGKNEEEIMQSLGSARLIAKSITDAYQEKESHHQPDYSEEITYDEDNERVDLVAEERSMELRNKIKTGIIIAGVIAVVGIVLVGLFKLLPFIIVAIAIYMLCNRFSK